jgi:uncharacterized protein
MARCDIDPRMRRYSILAVALAAASVAVVQAQSMTVSAAMRAYNMGDYQTAYRLLHDAADAGDPEAEVNLGYMYARGQVVVQDERKAVDLYQRSANQGDGEGMNALGYVYAFGSKPDKSQAVHWFCQAVARGNPRAMNNLAGMLYSGDDGVPRDIDQARSLWEQAAALGNSGAMLNLGRSYADSDKATGVQWVKRAALAGQPDAQGILRSSGYAGAFPPPRSEAAMMIPETKNTPGKAKICGVAG